MMQNICIKIQPEYYLFFDLDGTLIDSTLANFLSYKKAVQTVTQLEFNLEYIPEKRFNRVMLRKVFPDLNDEIYNLIIQQKERIFQDFLSEVRLNKNVIDILFAFSKSNKTILVTNCRQNRAILILNHFDLVKKFSCMYFRDKNGYETQINKYRNTIESLKIKPNLILVFENEKAEVKNAIKAGIPNNNIFLFKNSNFVKYE